MIALIQRVERARVDVGRGVTVARIGAGLLALIGVEQGDDEAVSERLFHRIRNYRVFDDGQGRMNQSVEDAGGGLLLVSQFTLAADTRKGLRPGFSTAAAPDRARSLYESLVEYAVRTYPGDVASGRFGADMKVHLVNDGPVTFWLRVAPP